MVAFENMVLLRKWFKHGVARKAGTIRTRPSVYCMRPVNRRTPPRNSRRPSLNLGAYPANLGDRSY
jgi:hypothetical protein